MQAQSQALEEQEEDTGVFAHDLDSPAHSLDGRSTPLCIGRPAELSLGPIAAAPGSVACATLCNAVIRPCEFNTCSRGTTARKRTARTDTCCLRSLRAGSAVNSNPLQEVGSQQDRPVGRTVHATACSACGPYWGNRARRRACCSAHTSGQLHGDSGSAICESNLTNSHAPAFAVSTSEGPC